MGMQPWWQRNALIGICLMAMVGCDNKSEETGSNDNATQTPVSNNDEQQDSVAGNCQSYCSSMAETCHGEAFHHLSSCLDWCEHPLVGMAMGTTSDTDVNTIGCRQHWLDRASRAEGAQKEVFCANAAASGGNQCGSWCQNYCDIGTAICTANNPDYPRTPARPYLFDSDDSKTAEQECLAACDFPTDVLEGVSQTDQHFGYGNTVQCRLHHFQAAMLEGPNQSSAYGLHCGHGAPTPTELCTDDTKPNMINYCEYAIGFCPDLFDEETTTTECRAQMGALIDDDTYKEGPFLSFRDTDKNSVGCLNYWIMKAPHDPETYCAKADWNRENWAPAGEGLCVGD